MRRNSLPSSSARSTSKTIPRRARIFSGKSLRSRAASSSPTTSPRSFLPISRTPPCALANPQIHFRYSSRHNRFHSRCWAFLSRTLPRPVISGDATPVSSPSGPLPGGFATLGAKHGCRRLHGGGRLASPGPRRYCAPAARPPSAKIGCRVAPPISAVPPPLEKAPRSPRGSPKRPRVPGSARAAVNETPQFRDAPPTSRTGGWSDRTPRARTGSACRSPVRAPSR